MNKTKYFTTLESALSYALSLDFFMVKEVQNIFGRKTYKVSFFPRRKRNFLDVTIHPKNRFGYVISKYEKQ